MGGGTEPIDHRPETTFGVEDVPKGMRSAECLRTSTVSCFYIIIDSRAYGGREAKPIDHRLKPRSGTDDVPRDDVRGTPTHEQCVNSCHLFVTVFSRAYGGREAEPIGHRLEPKFGTDNVPRG